MESDFVELTKEAKKGLKRAPDYIVDKFESWVHAVEDFGLRYVRKLPGYHDEPLKGVRKGQRSIRLSKSYRAIYQNKKGRPVVIVVLEVNKHEY